VLTLRAGGAAMVRSAVKSARGTTTKWRSKPGGDGMGDVVNFKVTRKKVLRRRAEAKAAANRAVHGRSKAERALDEARATKMRRELDAHRIDAGDGP